YCHECGAPLHDKRLGPLCDEEPIVTTPGPLMQTQTSHRHNFMNVVGEAFHQDALQMLLRTHGRHVSAFIVPESDSPYDVNAVKIVIEGQDVGRLSRDVAKTFGPPLRVQRQPMVVSAELHGGKAGKPSIGVVLDFSAVYAIQAAAAVK